MGNLVERDIIYILCGLLVGFSVVVTAGLVLWDIYIKRKSAPKRHWREG